MFLRIGRNLRMHYTNMERCFDAGWTLPEYSGWHTPETLPEPVLKITTAADRYGTNEIMSSIIRIRLWPVEPCHHCPVPGLHLPCLPGAPAPGTPAHSCRWSAPALRSPASGCSQLQTMRTPLKSSPWQPALWWVEGGGGEGREGKWPERKIRREESAKNSTRQGACMLIEGWCMFKIRPPTSKQQQQQHPVLLLD